MSASVYDWCRQLLYGTELPQKLAICGPIQSLEREAHPASDYPALPGRNSRLTFSQQQLKFPKVSSLNQNQQKAMALHFFANHELLAIEMMAACLLRFPWSELGLRSVRHLIETIQDEQKHLKLYLDRMEDFETQLGDYPLNDFFWKHLEALDTPAKFFSTMALTFESANLDFAYYYAQIFKGLKDFETADILQRVYEDELRHVKRGQLFLSSQISDKELWDYYQESLPWPITPARAKGIAFSPDHRRKAGLPESFIHRLLTYKDTFAVTKRRLRS